MTDYERLRKAMAQDQERVEKLLSIPYDDFIKLPQEVINQLAPPGPVSEYVTLAMRLLGGSFEIKSYQGYPAAALWSHEVMSTFEGSRRIGDLSEQADQRLAVVCGLSPTEWERLDEPERIPWMEKAFACRSLDEVPVTTPPGTAVKVWLDDWNDICSAVGLDYQTERNKLKDLNKRLNGPVQIGQKGSGPMVEKSELLVWWDRLDIEHTERANRRSGRALSASESYQHGREGAVAPEIRGSVKKRRSDRRT